MVDKINPLGRAQDVLSGSKPSKPHDAPKSEKSSSIVDEVVISEEALSLAQVKDTAKQLAGQLNSDENATLSNDESRLNALI